MTMDNKWLLLSRWVQNKYGKWLKMQSYEHVQKCDYQSPTKHRCSVTIDNTKKQPHRPVFPTWESNQCKDRKQKAYWNLATVRLESRLRRGCYQITTHWSAGISGGTKFATPFKACWMRRNLHKSAHMFSIYTRNVYISNRNCVWICVGSKMGRSYSLHWVTILHIMQFTKRSLRSNNPIIECPDAIWSPLRE